MMIGFIGLGNMAKAMIGGILRQQIAKPEEIIGSSATQATREQVADTFGIRTENSNVEVARQAQILILAVKPVVLPPVLEEIREYIGEDTLIISVAAGKKISWFEERLNSPARIVRFMPNTPALVGEGCTAVCRNQHVSEEELEEALRLASSFGMAEVVSEQMLDVAGAVSGASPAYVFMFIEALADAAVKAGMPRKQAYRFSAQAVMGSAKLLLETGRHPGELKDMVCSPGGTTIEGVQVLEQEGMRAAVMDAIEACMEKTKRL